MLLNLPSEDEFLERAANIPLQSVRWRLAEKKGIEVVIRRDDLIDEYLSGNKFYKLFYNLQAAKRQGCTQIVSFGGAHSNHIYALAAAGSRYGFKTIGVIRGERPQQLSPCLRDAEAWGMHLHFVTRASYSQGLTEQLAQELLHLYGDFYSLPEGGDNELGAKGTQVMGWAIRQQLNADYTSVCVACGTGNTLAGLASGLSNPKAGIAIGFSVLKGEAGLGQRICEQQILSQLPANNWRVISGFHGGGYAKKLPPLLKQFYTEFEAESGLELDPVYTLKMCWGVAQLMAQDYWPSASRLVLVHTGGLQGKRGFKN